MPGRLCEVIYRCYHLYFIHEENKAQRDEVTLHSWYVAQPGFKPEMGGTPESLLGHHGAAGTGPS